MTGISGCDKALRVFKRVCLASMITIALAGNALAQSESDLREYDIPSGNLVQAVNGISQKSGVQVVYDIELLRGKSIGTVKGRLSTRQALDKAVTALDAHEIKTEKRDGGVSLRDPWGIGLNLIA